MAAEAGESPGPSEPVTRPKKRPALVFIILTVLVLAVGTGLYVWRMGPKSPVPKRIQNRVSFHIYYPDQKKMPVGYTLDTETFRIADSAVVLFSVSYSSGRSMAFSEQARPAGDVMDKFLTSAIPVHTGLTTPLGKAAIGAYGSGKDLRTVASLPINNGPWLIVTAPSDINQTDLSRILQAVIK